jgi:hypothetical protein
MRNTNRPDVAIAILLRAIDEWFEKGIGIEMITNTEGIEWVVNFITADVKKGVLWYTAWDETQAYELGTYRQHSDAVIACLKRALQLGHEKEEETLWDHYQLENLL